MLPIYTYNQIKQWDAHTSLVQGISNQQLIIRAANAFCHWFEKKFTSPDLKLVIICGYGLNGEDGLAIAKILANTYYSVQIWYPGDLTKDQKIERGIEQILATKVIKEIDNDPDIIIDALLGIGLSRPIKGTFAELIEWANARTSSTRIAVDIPSGLSIGQPSIEPIIQVDYTFTFASPKLPMFFSEYANYVGEWQVGSIDMVHHFSEDTKATFQYLEQSDIKGLIKKLNRHDHKGHRGHVLLIGGSIGKMGAATLMSKASLRSGVGLCTTAAPGDLQHILQIGVPEAMTVGLHDLPESFDAFNAIGIGPGLSKTLESEKILSNLLDQADLSLVLDADALNIISDKGWQERIPKDAILTPHPKEFSRLFGNTNSSFELVELALAMAKKHTCYIILKGAYSLISTPEGSGFFNSSGNEGMATAGSGDTLTGIISSLLAQGYKPLDAALIGTYLHGLAGDIAIRKINKRSLMASDLIDHISLAFNAIINEKE